MQQYKDTDDLTDGRDEPITLDEFASIVRESLAQPPWRAQADKEADYADGNQLSTDLLRRMRDAGIPPAKENIITPAIAAVCGYEAKMRTDWRVTPDGDPGGQDVADALNYRLNQAERHSRADAALSKAFKQMVTTGLGWVEVSRASNSRDFPYKCRTVHRNEIWWDMKSTEADMSDARWLYRRRWVSRKRAAGMFPEHIEIIRNSPDKWIGDLGAQEFEGGHSTGLRSSAEAERAWTVQEDVYYNDENNTVCITELWYRRWVNKTMLKLETGRVVEYDAGNELHQAALQMGQGRLVEELWPVVRRGYWMGPHCLFDGPSPYPHQHFPYVRLCCYQEDMTGIPFGLVRDMLFPQDSLNSTISKLRHAISTVETIRTKGALAMSDHQFRQMAARPDADFVLDAEHFRNNPGAKFERKRDFQLNAQHFQFMQDSRAAANRVSGISPSFQGQTGTATSGVQEQTQVEQSQVTLSDLFDSFKDARSLVGEILLALIIEDIGKKPETVIIEGDVINPPRTVQLNVAEIDAELGITTVSNDVQRTRLRVALEDVPTTSSFRAQQLNALSEATKSAPPDIQQVVMPFMIDLMDLPRKKEVVQAIRDAKGQADPEQMREQVKQELMHDLKERELAIKERLTEAQIRKIVADAVQSGIAGTFAAMQAGEKIAMNPLIAPIGDIVMKQAGWQAPNPAGQDPNIPAPEQAQIVQDPGGLPGDTDPLTPQPPMQPQSPSVGAEEGIETLRAD